MFSFFKKSEDLPRPSVPRPVQRKVPTPAPSVKLVVANPERRAPQNSPAASDQISDALEVTPTPSAGRKLIEQLNEVPSSQGLLTVGSRAIIKIPAALEFDIVAIERGPKRVSILYNPGGMANPAMKSVMTSLRTKLTSEGYQFEAGGDYPCKQEVIRLMVDDYLSKSGASEAGDVNRVRSQARERFLNWMEIAVKEGATDIHVQVTGQSRAIVQLRVDGELENLRDERGGVYTQLEATEAMAWPFNSGSVKGSNSSSTWEPSRNLYCMTEPRVIKNRMVALRYQSLKGYQGPKVIARILNVDSNLPTLSYEQLGYAESQRLIMLDVANMPSGFVFFAGVTGSGKTTSLKTFIETHPGNGAMAIYSIEDPVEYPLKGVHQIALQRDISDAEGSKKMYNETVASLMRADPDVVIVGEIRDVATAAAGQQIVETGHMALGTVHAHLIPGIIPRLTNAEIGMSRDALTNPKMLSLLAYQALTPKLCKECCFDPLEALEHAKKLDMDNPGVANEELHLRDILVSIDSRFGVDSGAVRFRNVTGCKHCGFRGTKGVTVVAEMLIPDRPWLEFTRAGKDYEAMVHYRQASDGKFDTPNMNGKTIFEHTLFNVINGRVDPRQCERFDSFKRFELAPKLTNSSSH